MTATLSAERPKDDEDPAAVDVVVAKRLLRSPIFGLVVASLIPSGVAGIGTNAVSTKLDAVLAEMTNLKIAVGKLQDANLDSRVRELERKVDRLELHHASPK